MAAITTIDDGDVCVLCHNTCCTRPIVPHHNDVGIIRHHPRSVGERFAFAGRSCAWVSEAEGPAVEPFHRTFKRKPGPCTRFIEERCEQFAPADARPCLQLRLHASCESKNLFNLKIRQIVECYQMPHVLPLSVRVYHALLWINLQTTN